MQRYDNVYQKRFQVTLSKPLVGAAVLSVQDDRDDPVQKVADALGVEANTGIELKEACFKELQQRCEQGDWETLKNLQPYLGAITNEQGQTLIEKAIASNDLPLIKDLLDNGLTHNTHQRGNTLLHLAVQCGNDAVIKVIAKHPNTLIDEKNSDGYTPLPLAILEGEKECTKQLASSRERIQRLLRHCRGQDTSKMLWVWLSSLGVLIVSMRS